MATCSPHKAPWIMVVLAALGPDCSTATASSLHKSIPVSPCLLANVSRQTGKKKRANYFIIRNGPEMSRIVDEHTVLGSFRAKILESKALAASPMDCVPECPQVWCPEVGTGEPMSYSWPRHKPINLLGFQAAAGLVASVHSSSSCSLTNFPD